MRFVLGMLWCVAIGHIPGTSSSGRQAAVATTTEENAVYRALADQFYKPLAGAPFLLQPATIIPDRHYEDGASERLRRESDSRLFDEYRRRSAELVSIGDSVGIPGTVFMNDSVRAAVADSLRRMQSSVGIHAFSRVGFTSARDSALVFTFRGCGMLCGKGGLFLLAKRDGKWLVVRMLYASAS